MNKTDTTRMEQADHEVEMFDAQPTPSLDRKTLLVLVDASRAINSELTSEDVFKRVAEWATTVLEAEGASVLLFDADRKQLVFQTAVRSEERRVG